MTQQTILNVSELTKKVKFLLESELNTVWLCGEISNFIAASSGHWYLSLKDTKSQVRCAMFRGNNRRVSLTPCNGQQVLVRAKISLYEPRGDFQLIIEQMEEAGTGLLQQQFQQLKSKLNQEGLFNLHHKKPIPSKIKTVGLITSPTGAAIKDILTVLNRRNPLLNVIIYPALVQGEQAKFDIEQAIIKANQRNEVDVLIISRGGGSLEDLWAFNEEMVARSVFQSVIPTISAVGHEIDTVLSDYVADLRAPTPSAAAELVSSDLANELDKLQSLNKRNADAIKKHLALLSNQGKTINHRLSQVHPEQQLRNKQQKSDELNFRLHNIIKRETQRLLQKPTTLQQRLLRVSPLNKINFHNKTLEQLTSRLITGQLTLLQINKDNFASQCEQLHLVSPLATIARGYSVVRDLQGNIIRSTNEVNVGSNIAIDVNDGKIQAKVIATEQK